MRKLTFALLLLAPLAALVGCGSGAPPTTAPNTPTGTPPTTPVAVSFSEVRFAELKGAVEAQKGKVVLMDYWATWCGPCVKKFPHLVATHKKYAEKGLVCMSVSLDPRGKEDKYSKDDVLKFLKEKDAAFPNYVLLDYTKDSDAVEKHFGLEGGIPFLVLFGKSGKRVWTSEEKSLSDEELDKLIEAELAK